MGIVGDMQHAEVLHIRAVTDADVVDITPNDGMEPDATGFAHDDIPDDDAGFFDEARCWNSRFDALESSNHGRTIGESAYPPQVAN